MSRSIEREEPEPSSRMPLAQGRSGSGSAAQNPSPSAGVRGAARPRAPELPSSRDRASVRVRSERYRLSEAESAVLFDVGRFRTIAVDDLRVHRYGGDPTALEQDL